jgi:hypothetical protein
LKVASEQGKDGKEGYLREKGCRSPLLTVHQPFLVDFYAIAHPIGNHVDELKVG